uniref:MFS transporter n=1 Tax=Algoriphagus sp. TaxID=1872435 RepID=UPI00258C29BA|nr:MFS transporter [Algoriphagus sp.]
MDAQLGLRQNWKQFSLLVFINAFVGGMIGMERSIFPDFATEVFGLESHAAMLGFIAAFGVSKAFTNYFTGRFANRFGRRNLLILGWILVLPVPVILNYAEVWSWIIFANILLGISQGLTWSSTVVMKIDLVGDKNRGLAMGLNEFAGYLAVGLAAVGSAYLTSRFGIRPVPFWVMGGMGILGFLFSFLVRDTHAFVKQEAGEKDIVEIRGVFWNTTWVDKSLSSVTQAGLVNNLNDGMIWGLLPVLLISRGFGLEEIGKIASVYPILWGMGQLFTGKMADHLSHKGMLFWGMLIQGLAIMGLIWVHSFESFVGLSVLLGLGTAVVYPTFMAAIAASSHPLQRAESLGTFRFWRDMGYAVGAVLSGVIADRFGVDYAVVSISGLTLISSLIVKLRMSQ